MTAGLDDPVGESLRGPHAPLARRRGRVATYRSGVATFSAVPPVPDAADWADLAALLGPGALADLFSAPGAPPGWQQVFSVGGLQMVGAPVAGTTRRAAGVVELGEHDVPDMLDLVARTRPGPFREDTQLMGRYVGVRVAGELVAMAGERLRPPGWTEVSAVCTAPEERGRGHAAAVVRALVDGIHDRGDRPFLHVVSGNTGAVALYERLGFVVRREVVFHGYLTPTSPAGSPGLVRRPGRR